MNFVRICLLLTFLLSVCNCKQRSMSERVRLVSYTPQEINQYYELLGVSHFTATEDQIEHRVCAMEAFTMEERQKRTEIVAEYTWEINKDSLLTVWYHRKNDSLYFLCLDRYSKDEVNWFFLYLLFSLAVYKENKSLGDILDRSMGYSVNLYWLCNSLSTI